MRNLRICHYVWPAAAAQRGISAYPPRDPRNILIRGSANPVLAVLKALSGEEFRPALHEIVVLVHQRVPDGDLGIAVPVGAAGANIALLDDDGAERVGQVLGRRLAVIPIIPFRRLEGTSSHCPGLSDSSPDARRTPPASQPVKRLSFLEAHNVGNNVVSLI